MRRWHWIAMAALLLVMAVEVGLSTRQESPSWDEGDHIYSGYVNWKYREYRPSPEQPPLVKLVAALPLLALDLKVPPWRGAYDESAAYFGGRELLFRNGPQDGGRYSADILLLRVHMAVLVFSLGLAVLLFVAGREMFGGAAGLIAMTLFVFDPSVLTNAPFVSMDMAAACGFFAAVYVFYRFVKVMTWTRAVVCGLVVGLALTAKFSALALVPVILLLAAGEVAARREGRHAVRMAIGLGMVAAVAVAVVWGVYSFRYASPQPWTLQGRAWGTLSPAARDIVLGLAKHRLLPESYLYGLVAVAGTPMHRPAFIFGKLYEQGQWFYFPALLSLKMTIGAMVLLGLAVWAFARGRVGRGREVFFLTLPALLFFGVAMASEVNIGIRHVLPVFPFLFLLAGGGTAWLIQRRGAWTGLVAAMLLWHAVDSVRMFPNYMPYANVLWGGAGKTNAYFSDSATDWGQQLKWTKQWLDAHQVKECWFAYYPAPFLLPSDYGIPCRLLPTLETVKRMDVEVPAVVHGPVLVSYSVLNGFAFGSKVRNPYQALFERRPDDVIADGIAVFEGDFALPRASALMYEQRAATHLKIDPEAAINAARTAVAIAPESFDANVSLGDSLAAEGKIVESREAYGVAMQRVADMEPSAQEFWRPIVEAKIKGVPETK